MLAAAPGPGGRGYIEYHSLAADSVTVDINGIRVAVASPEHLLASKIGARRPKDLRSRKELERLASELADD